MNGGAILKLLIFFSLFSYVGMLFLAEPIQQRQGQPIYFAPPETIKHFSLGFSDLYADFLWLRLIQDMDFCSSQKGTPVYDGSQKYQCETGWSYKMTDSLTELAPRFRKPYRMAGSILSVVMGDKEGAKRIYDKAVQRFPEDWRIHFSAGYHYLVEIKDRERASELLIKSADKGGPKWLYALASKQYGELGKYYLAQKVLLDFKKRDKEERYKGIIEKRLKSIESKIKNLKTGL